MISFHSLFVVATILIWMSSHFTKIETINNNITKNLLFQSALFQRNREERHLQNVLTHSNNADWLNMADIASHVWVIQNDLHNRTVQSKNNLLIIIFDNTTLRIVGTLEEVLSNLHIGLNFLYFNMNDIENDINVRNSLNYLGNIPQINSVFFLTKNQFCNSVIYLLNYVSSNIHFKWTSLIHTAEWIIVTSNPNGLETLTTTNNTVVDFITLIVVLPEQSVTISQKSRKEGFQNISSWSWFDHSTEGPRCVCTSRETFVQSIRRNIGLLRRHGKLRANAMRYLQSQKSVLDGLIIPVSLFLIGEKVLYRNNKAELDGYCIGLLELIASTMGFTYRELFVDDNGFYGTVNVDGRITGILGHLARREATFSPASLIIMENRPRYIDYIPVPMVIGTTSFFYRLPRENLDETYLYIFRRDFFLLCLGLALIACVVGAFLHVTTDSCTQPAPARFAFRHLRRLATFPDHICFQATTHTSQSSRALTASWSIMCLVCVSAYSAYLTSTFTATAPELAIKSFKDIIDAKNYEFGIHESLSGIRTLLKHTNDSAEKKAWDLLVRTNNTDPRITGKDSNYHMERVIAGKYVFIAPKTFSPREGQLRDDIRRYQFRDILNNYLDFICLPKNVFYKNDLHNLLLSLHESNINQFLLEKYKIPIRNQNNKVKKGNNPIQFSRIELPVYVVLAGVGISAVCLFMEIVCNWYVQKWLLRRVKS